MEGTTIVAGHDHPRREVESAVVRFAGDSGDGMQLTGSQFTLATAIAGNDLATFPDFPAEIRAPTGTTFGVSAFQINFGGRRIKTVGDVLDTLVVMNPAALKVNLEDLRAGGLLIADAGAFGATNLKKAGYAANPLEDETVAPFTLLSVDISKLTLDATKESGLSKKEALRCKNMWALGLVYWMYGRDRAPTEAWLRAKFAKRPDIADANVAALAAGHAFGETAEVPAGVETLKVPPAPIPPGRYRTVTGTEAVSWGLVTGCQKAELPMVFCSYPITPASAVLHTLAGLHHLDVTTFQAEDEIAAACAAIGASYAGSVGVTSSSGPGMALKTEAIGLAIGAELPLVILDVQRAGPSTGMPTKTEQSDLYQAVYGRNGDAPLVVLAARSPGDCFGVAVEAVRLATKYMTPVIVLSDGYIANASEPWPIPDVDAIEAFPVRLREDPEGFQPFSRDTLTLARPWVAPGTPGLEHRLGGLERADGSGHISYDPSNHQRMTTLRADKIAGIARDIPEQSVDQGRAGARVAVLGWGSTYGPISRAVTNLLADGVDVAHVHLRYISPLPANLETLLSGFEHVLVPEMNNSQLITLLRAQFLSPAKGLSKVTGKPFKVREIEEAVRGLLESDR